MTDEWAVDRLDLPAYLDRVGQREGDPTAETLARLHRAHVAAIPFENLDVVVGRGVRVDLEAVQDKLVRHDRGGYCYEHGVGRIVVVREDEDSRTRLVGRTLTRVDGDGVEARREVDDAELPVVLRERFGIVLDPEDLAAVLAAPGDQERS